MARQQSIMNSLLAELKQEEEISLSRVDIFGTPAINIHVSTIDDNNNKYVIVREISQTQLNSLLCPDKCVVDTIKEMLQTNRTYIATINNHETL